MVLVAVNYFVNSTANKGENALFVALFFFLIGIVLVVITFVLLLPYHKSANISTTHYDTHLRKRVESLGYFQQTGSEYLLSMLAEEPFSS